MKKSVRSPFLAMLALSLASAAPLLAQSGAATPALGLIIKSVAASVGNGAASDGASIYSGDYLSTGDNGSLLVRVGPMSVELQASSALHIYSAPYGAVIELNRGSVIYTTPGGKENLVIVASDVRVTPDPSLPELGRVTIDNPCEITVYSQRGQASAKVGSESHTVEEGKAYRVRAESKISYREYLSPDADNYHRYHEHEPCAPVEMVKGHLPIAPATSHFLLVSGALIGVGAGIATWKALESPDRP
jgi:hypothetical protein